MIATISRTFQYEFWATSQYINIVNQNLPTTESIKSDKILSLLTHILVAQRIWMNRMNGIEQTFEPWTIIDSSKLEEWLMENRRLFTDFFSRFTVSQIHNLVTYKNSTGKEFQTSNIDILTQLSHHGAYHRGQVSILLKELEIVIPPTDYIYFVRQNF